MDFEAEGLLEGLDGKAREARLQLLGELEEDGASLEEMRDAVAQDRLALLPVERKMVGDGRRYTADEIAEEAGIDVELLRGQRGALGLPVDDSEGRAGYTEDDLRAAKRFKVLIDAGLPRDGVVEVTRVVGLAMSQIASASNALIGGSVLHAGDTELDASRRYVAAADALQPLLAPTLEHALNLHLLESLRNFAIGQAELASGSTPGAQEITACFADLVGFTRLGEELPAEELGQVSGRLSALARDVAAGPVRLVKMIGDAAMLVSPEPEATLEAALTLVEAAHQEEDGFPELRAGVATGPALARAGDWYGRPVNLASRVTGIARPGSVLATESAQDAAPDAFDFSFAGERAIRGIQGKVKLFRVRRPDAGEDS